MRLKYWYNIPPWIIIGAILILFPVFLFWTIQNINKEKSYTRQLLLEKGSALIRSIEAGTRTGMMGMMGMKASQFRLQRLITETAQQPDIIYIMVTDSKGRIIAHSDSSKIGGFHDTGESQKFNTLNWRKLVTKDGNSIFEVYRRFSPLPSAMGHHHLRIPWGRMWQDIEPRPPQEPLIFIGLDMSSIEQARSDDIRHSIIMGFIMLLIGFAGIFILFLVQAYQSTRSSLNQVKALSDSIIENLPIGLLLLDKNGRIITINPEIRSLFPGLNSLNQGDMIYNNFDNNLNTFISEVISKGKLQEREIELQTDDGKSMILDIMGSEVQDPESHQVIGYLFLFKDLTEWKRLKDEIDKNRRLASLGRLAAGIAHEIRNPLSSIKGFATYFKERYQDVPEDKQTAEVMLKEVERLNRSITQLLDFSRPLKLQKIPIKVQDLINHTLSMMERDERIRHITISRNMPEQDVFITGDQDRLTQVLLNIILNAIEAIENQGKISISVINDRILGKVRIEITDTGKGIKEEDLEHIFDPYFTTKSTGTGLGLAIVHRIIEAHSGSIKVESRVGSGTRVILELPSNST